MKDQKINRRNFLKTSVAGVSFITFSNSLFAQSESPVATTKYGKVRGYLDNNVSCFKGIRYGADTAGRRFMSPLPPEKWTDIKDATAYGKSSPQQSRGDNTSEDCLFLNVFTPKLRDGGKRPVMFYIHGGAFANGSGSSSLYDGVRLCNRGNVVVVSINHRLNAFGYLYLARFGGAEFADSGNAGQLDLILALQWIRENIAEFGGDPNNIMLFGQSGGGAKIATMMAMPAASGMFQKAATMSGQQVTACGPWNGTLRAKAILDALKIGKENIQQIRTIPFEKIVEVLNTKDPVLSFGGVNFAPALDEKNLLRHPFYPDAPAQSNHVPMIIGNTHDETRAFLGGDESNFKLTWEELPEKLIPNMRVDIKPEEVIEKYRKIYPNLTASDLLFKITTASRSWRGAVIEAEERAKAGFPAFAYQLDWKTTRNGGKFGAPHGADIQLVFDNIGKPGATAEGPTAQKMADIMSETFLAFARRGNPNNKSIPLWKPYTMARRETMVFDAPPHLENDPRGEERKIFGKVPYVQPGT
jgi:para-nitrobenzyl esterase